MELSRLDGRFADRPFALAGTASAEWDARRMALSGLRIDGGLGRIEADGELARGMAPAGMLPAMGGTAGRVAAAAARVGA